jgi:hypothetical protein
MIVGEEDLLKIGYSENVEGRFPKGDFRILFSRPDTRIPDEERLRRYLQKRRTGKNPEMVTAGADGAPLDDSDPAKGFKKDRKEGFVEQSILAFCGGLGIRKRVKYGGEWRTEGGGPRGPGGNGRTEMIHFDLETTQIIRTNLGKAPPEVRDFLEIALRFAGNQPSEPNKILGMVYAYEEPSDIDMRPMPVLAPETLPVVDIPWNGVDVVPDIDHPPEAPQEWKGRSSTVYGGHEGYQDPDDGQDEDPDEAPTGPEPVEDEEDDEGERLYGVRVRSF